MSFLNQLLNYLKENLDAVKELYNFINKWFEDQGEDTQDAAAIFCAVVLAALYNILF